MILSHRQCPGIDHDTRSDLVAALTADDERDAPNFIDDIAMSEAIWREGLEPVDRRPSRKRMRAKRNPETLCGSSPQAGTLLLPAEDKDTEGLPEWFTTKTARCRYAALATRTRDKLK